MKLQGVESMAVKYTVPRGTYDILPAASYKWQFVTRIFRELAEVFNYREIVTPIFEASGLFERSVGDSSDIVTKEMYKFLDKKGREFALRPEGTAPVVRAYLENNLDLQDNSSKLYYTGPMFRYDRPQQGRYRQFYQYGIEYIGGTHPYMDAEVIAFGYNYFRRLGLTNFTLEINSIGCRNCSSDYDRALIDFFLPFEEKLCPDCRIRLRKNPKRLLDCKVEACARLAAQAPVMLDYLDEECRRDFAEVQRCLGLMDIPFQINPRIVRGLDYYTKTAFEFINRNLGAQNALCGGGRYDGLAEDLGGKSQPGVGLAGGFERLLLSLEKENADFGRVPAPRIYLVTLGEKAADKGIELLARLRNAGLAMETDISRSSLRAQLKAADKSGAEYTLILGEEELDQGRIQLKNMQTGSQKDLDIDRLPEILPDLISPPTLPRKP